MGFLSFLGTWGSEGTATVDFQAAVLTQLGLFMLQCGLQAWGVGGDGRLPCGELHYPPDLLTVPFHLPFQALMAPFSHCQPLWP